MSLGKGIRNLTKNGSIGVVGKLTGLYDVDRIRRNRDLKNEERRLAIENQRQSVNAQSIANTQFAQEVTSQAAQPNSSKKKKLGLYIGIGAGALLVIGVVIFLIIKKK